MSKKKNKHPVVQNTITDPAALYGNIMVLSPKNEQMFMANKYRIGWYERNDLIEWLDETTVRLKFTPRAPGHHEGHPYYLSIKDNVCVVCGRDSLLTKHHVVPSSFRTNFPKGFKKGNSHDVLLVCRECHNKYNKQTSQFLNQLAQEIGISFHSNCAYDCWKTFPRAIKFSRTLLKYGDLIPEDRKNILYATIKRFLRKDNILLDDIKYLDSLASKKRPDRKRRMIFRRNRPFIKKVLEKYDPNEFSTIWRKHFIKTMNPKFLPEHWDVNYQLIDYYRDRENRDD